MAAEKGTKRVMLKNIQEAKFQRVLLPIAQVALAKMGVVRPEVQRVLERLKNVPVDIAPRYVTAEKLLQETAGSPSSPKR